MKKIAVILASLAIATTAFGYKTKPESADLTRYEVANFAEAAKGFANIKFDRIGNVYDAAGVGFYPFAQLIQNGEKADKLVGYMALTHIKAYQKHLPLMVAMNIEGTILDVMLPENLPGKNHQEVNARPYRDLFVGKKLSDNFVDGLAGSTFMANSINGEVKNILLQFKYNNDLITEKPAKEEAPKAATTPAPAAK